MICKQMQGCEDELFYYQTAIFRLFGLHPQKIQLRFLKEEQVIIILMAQHGSIILLLHQD